MNPDAIPKKVFKPGMEVCRHQIRKDRIKSRFFESERVLTVVLPPTYGDARRRYPTLYLHDGSEDWLERGHLLVAMEQALADDRLPEFIVILPEPGRRTREYKLSASHLAFMTEEVVPWADRNLRTRARPAGRAVHGVSLGGLSAVWLGLKRPDLFGAAGGQGGSYWFWKQRVVREVGQVAPVACRFFLSCGTQDGNLSDNRKLGAALQDRGIRCCYDEVPGRHSWSCWRRTFPLALRYYFAQALA